MRHKVFKLLFSIQKLFIKSLNANFLPKISKIGKQRSVYFSILIRLEITAIFISSFLKLTLFGDVCVTRVQGTTNGSVHNNMSTFVCKVHDIVCFGDWSANAEKS